MRTLLRKEWSVNTPVQLEGDDRKQKTWQLTDDGREEAKNRLSELSKLKVLIRDESNTLLEVEASEAPGRLQAIFLFYRYSFMLSTKAC